MKARIMAIAAVLCLLASLVLGGLDPLGRVALALGQPRWALAFLSDPAWRGVAAYRVGDFDTAATEFTRAGDLGLNLGNAQVHGGDYAAALEAFDRGRVIGDAEAAANFELLRAYYAGLALDPDTPIGWAAEDREGPQMLAPEARGSARASSDGDGVTNRGASLGMPRINSLLENRVRKVFDDKFMVANSRWLATLEDVPGEYLAARIAHEHKRRVKLGLAPPEPEDPR